MAGGNKFDALERGSGRRKKKWDTCLQKTLVPGLSVSSEKCGCMVFILEKKRHVTSNSGTAIANQKQIKTQTQHQKHAKHFKQNVPTAITNVYSAFGPTFEWVGKKTEPPIQGGGNK